jgi:hypothetical protein
MGHLAAALATAALAPASIAESSKNILAELANAGRRIAAAHLRDFVWEVLSNRKAPVADESPMHHQAFAHMPSRAVLTRLRCLARALDAPPAHLTHTTLCRQRTTHSNHGPASCEANTLHIGEAPNVD